MSAVEGRRVMIVEDNFLIAGVIADTISARGGCVLGPYLALGDAISALESGVAPDVALLDVNLDGTSFGVAAMLTDRAIPYVFVTGHAADIPPALRHEIICCKPFTSASLLIALRAALAREPELRRIA
jgi:CheY-like chemotaxis protein